jgi:hypothetical protein
LPLRYVHTEQGRPSPRCSKQHQPPELLQIRSTEDRFEISPTLKLLFSPEEILALTQIYQRMASGEVISITPADPQDEGSDS